MLINPFHPIGTNAQTVPVQPMMQNQVPVLNPTMPPMGMPAHNTGLPQFGASPMHSSLNMFGALPNLASLGGSMGQSIRSPQQACSLIVRKMVMIETKPQQNQHMRAMETRIDNTTVNIMNNFKDTSPTMRLNGNVIGDLQRQGAKFFEISSQPNQMVNIVNGWITVRLKFTITVDVYFAGKLNCTEYVAGYTDYAGANFSTKHLDPEMVFVIDSVTTSQPHPSAGAIGGIGHSVVGSNLVIAKNNIQGFGSPQHMVTTRPVDVFSELMISGQRKGAEIAAGMGSMEGFSAQMRPTYMNINTTVGHTPVFSNMFNNVPTNYAARILDAHGKIINMSNDGTDIYAGARSEVIENVFTSSKFVHMLDEKSSDFDGFAGNTFKLKRLYSIDPVLASPMDDRIVIIRPDEFMRELQRTVSGDIISIPAGTCVESLSGTGEKVANAAAILHSANAHFRKAGASYVSCVLTNHGGQPESRITSVLGIDDGLLYMRVTAACESIMSETIRGITRDQMSYFIQITMDVHNDAYIKIQLGMDQASEYVTPCYALGSISPVVAIGQPALDSLVDSVRDITDSIYGPTLTIGGPVFNPNAASY